VTATLVGPLSRVRFADGTQLAADVPRDTLDIRYSACGNHHLACDCREASMAEAFAERRAECDALYDAIAEAIKGHPTWAYSRDGWHVDELGQCKCHLCCIARKCRVGYFEWRKAREEADRQLYPEEEPSF